jgi:predicted N-acyltransferase
VDGSAQIEIEVLTGLDQIAPEDWDACACPEAADGGRPNDPFTTHRFLSALERSRSVGTGTGWQVRHLVARCDGEVIACAPLYAKATARASTSSTTTGRMPMSARADGTTPSFRWRCLSPRRPGGGS